MAIAATMLKEADIYFFDEPSSYLDIYQRLQVAKVIQSLSREKYVVVVEHDLAVLDFPGGHGLPDVRRGGRVRNHCAAAAGPHRDQRVSRRLPEGGEHPLPGSRDPLRHPPTARRLEGGDARHVR